MDSLDETQPHPGERLASYFDSFFKTIVGVCTLGASITFAKIVQSPVTPWINYGYTSHQIQSFLGLSWLFFILDLAVTSFAASALSLYRPVAVKYFGTEDSLRRRVVMWYATGVSILLFGLLLAAFLFLGLVVVAYLGPTGWTAVGFTAFFGLVGLGSIVWQSPIGSKAPGVPYKKGDEGYDSAGGKEKMSWNEKGEGIGGVKEILNREDLEKDDVRYGDGTPPRLSRGSTLVRPTPTFVPPYTEEVRKYRAYRSIHGSGVSVREGFAKGDELENSENKTGHYYHESN